MLLELEVAVEFIHVPSGNYMIVVKKEGEAYLGLVYKSDNDKYEILTHTSKAPSVSGAAIGAFTLALADNQEG